MRDVNHDLCAACTSVSSVGRLNGADEFKRTRKGRRPAPTPPNETRFPPYEPIYPIGPAPRRGRARRADVPSRKARRYEQDIKSWKPLLHAYPRIRPTIEVSKPPAATPHSWKGLPMSNATTFVGLDVHARSVKACAFVPDDKVNIKIDDRATASHPMPLPLSLLPRYRFFAYFG